MLVLLSVSLSPMQVPAAILVRCQLLSLAMDGGCSKTFERILLWCTVYVPTYYSSTFGDIEGKYCTGFDND